MDGRVAAAAGQGQINVIPWEAYMHAGGEPGATASSDPRSRGVGGQGEIGGWRWWRFRQTSVSGSRRAVLPVGEPVFADTRTPNTACARVPMCGVRDAHGDGARSSERETTAETRPGAYARLAGLFGYALRITHAACTRLAGSR